MKQFNLEEYLKNPSRKVVTRDGRAVKIHCTDYIDEGGGSVIAKIEGDTYSNSFREDGRYVDYEETNNDLFFAPKKHEGWVNLYRNLDNEPYCIGNIYDSEEEAINNRAETAIATVKIEWEE